MENPRIQLLDCTLREAPINELMWGDFYIKQIINGLEKANIDIIECGFLKNDEYKFGSTSFHKAEELKKYLKNKKKDIISFVLFYLF